MNSRSMSADSLELKTELSNVCTGLKLSFKLSKLHVYINQVLNISFHNLKLKTLLA